MMKNIRKVVLTVLLIVLCFFVCGCKLEHGHFEFVIEEFKDLDQSEYVTSDKLDDYKIQDIVVRPWIKNVYDDVTYSVGIYGYSDGQAVDKKIKIDKVHLYAKDNKDLVNVADCDIVINYSQNDSNACFVGNKICQFVGDIDTINSYGVLYMELSVTISGGEETKSTTLLYEIDIVQYLTSYMVT